MGKIYYCERCRSFKRRWQCRSQFYTMRCRYCKTQVLKEKDLLEVLEKKNERFNELEKTYEEAYQKGVNETTKELLGILKDISNKKTIEDLFDGREAIKHE